MANWILENINNGDSIELPQDLHWIDEFTWSDLAQSTPVYTLGGSVILQQSTKQSGRPITLSGEWVWLRRGDYEKLQAWSAEAKLHMRLTHYDGREFMTTFRTHDKAIDCEPVLYRTPELPSDEYTGSINLMVI
ncbi:MAG: hypothetical protein CR962_00175 [Gammaproteobacteria bacterium]|nr:MAG: hypothetical protein CR962_00175 [Gammaproteobacteria bacterium]